MLFAIALGGAAGSVARYGVGRFFDRGEGEFPVGTLLVNIAGCLLLGFLVRYFNGSTMSTELRAALTIGFCGGFTTFSTFSLETIRLAESGNWQRAALYVFASVVLSLAALAAGLAAARAFTPLARS